MPQQKAPNSPCETPPSSRRRRGRAVRAVVGSSDFYLGVPLGMALAGLPLVYPAVTDQIPTILLASAGIGAALGALVLTAMTVLLSVLGSAYREMLRRVPGGIVGTLVPYRQVTAISAGASVAGLAAAMIWPAATIGALRWVIVALPLGLLCWAVLGCVQVVDQLVMHVSNNQRAEDIARRHAEALARKERTLQDIDRPASGETK